jgi:phospholipase/carboxylesterase
MGGQTRSVGGRIGFLGFHKQHDAQDRREIMSNTPALSLHHLAQQPRRRSEGAPPLLILLHGYGSNEQDLFGLAPYVDPRFLVISARAPHILMPGGYAWFELEWTNRGVVIDFAQAEQSRELAAQFVGQVAGAYGADMRQIYLCGFSQGAIVSACIALTEPELVEGVVLMSGRVPSEVRPLIAAPQRLERKPFLVTHGLYDQVLPIDNGRASRALLETLPVALTYREYPMAHEVSAESLADVTGWLTTRLDEDGSTTR